jgi:hypothetical protein
MLDVNKKVFLSYRRKHNKYVARSVYQYLKGEGYDVFMDIESIDSGQFSPVILGQIEARPHFLVVLTPGSLKSTTDPGDWLRREIEHAMEKDRNIVPIVAEGFTFEDEEKGLPENKKFPRKLSRLKTFNWLDLPDNYFEDAMRRLTDRFLKKHRKIEVVSTPEKDRTTVQRMIEKADGAARQVERETEPDPEAVVTDARTGLMWTRDDNGGRNISWHNANRYAKNLRLGGYTDWQLPSIEELERLYEHHGGKYNIRKPFRLSGWWVWSASRDGSGENWGFGFLLGERDRGHFVHQAGGARALCVRRSGE